MKIVSFLHGLNKVKQQSLSTAPEQEWGFCHPIVVNEKGAITL
jgi:hypothetical protein